MARLLLTGFEPFERFDRNPSWDGLEHARDAGLLDGLGAPVSLALLPVIYAKAFRTLEAAVDKVQPTAMVSFGVHPGRGRMGYRSGTFYLERLARNHVTASRPDNAGEARAAGPIAPHAPATIPSGLPIDRMLAGLHAAGFDTVTADDAGNYLCNFIFFSGALAFGGRIPFGFVHVPPTVDHGGTLPLERLAEGMALIARYALEARLPARTGPPESIEPPGLASASSSNDGGPAPADVPPDERDYGD